MGISTVCNKSVKAASVSYEAQNSINEYCEIYARKLLGNPTFSFVELPDSIVEVAFYGHGEKPESWSSFLKSEVRKELLELGYKI